MLRDRMRRTQTFQMDGELIKAIKTAAKAEGRSLSEIARRAFTAYLGADEAWQETRKEWRAQVIADATGVESPQEPQPATTDEYLAGIMQRDNDGPLEPDRDLP